MPQSLLQARSFHPSLPEQLAARFPAPLQQVKLRCCRVTGFAVKGSSGMQQGHTAPLCETNPLCQFTPPQARSDLFAGWIQPMGHRLPTPELQDLMEIARAFSSFVSINL